MDSQTKGQEHGAAVRRRVGYAAFLGSAAATAVVRNVRQVRDYALGFGQGLLRERDSLPNA